MLSFEAAFIFITTTLAPLSDVLLLVCIYLFCAAPLHNPISNQQPKASFASLASEGRPVQHVEKKRRDEVVWYSRLESLIEPIRLFLFPPLPVGEGIGPYVVPNWRPFS